MKKTATLIVFFMTVLSFSQENKFTKYSVITRFGLGYLEGNEESGFGSNFTFGVQRSFGLKEKLRVQSILELGRYDNRLASDMNDLSFSSCKLGLNGDYDFIRIHSFSFTSNLGFGLLLTEGLEGTGAEFGSNSSKYFSNAYIVGEFGLGIRVSKKTSRISFNFKPINMNIGKELLIFTPKIGIDIKL